MCDGEIGVSPRIIVMAAAGRDRGLGLDLPWPQLADSGLRLGAASERIETSSWPAAMRLQESSHAAHASTCHKDATMEPTRGMPKQMAAGSACHDPEACVQLYVVEDPSDQLAHE